MILIWRKRLRSAHGKHEGFGKKGRIKHAIQDQQKTDRAIDLEMSHTMFPLCVPTIYNSQLDSIVEVCSSR